MTPVVRLYQPQDRSAVLEIAADTGFFGAPVEAFLDDRRLMQDIFVAYYVDREPEHLWVADLDGTTVGYICGSVGGRAAARGQARTSAAAVLRLVTFRYKVGALHATLLPARRHQPCCAASIRIPICAATRRTSTSTSPKPPAVSGWASV